MSIGSDLPGNLVGDCLSICEFVNIFGSLFDLECYFDEPVSFGKFAEEVSCASFTLDQLFFSCQHTRASNLKCMFEPWAKDDL